MLYGLDLFSGIGGISLGLAEWVKPVSFCEIDDYCRRLLECRMQDKDLPTAPIYSDVKDLRGEGFDVDIITAGFPCQDISIAGNGAGLGGKRSGLFFEIIRLLKETTAPWCFLENVPAIRTRGLKEVIGAFTEMGYDCRWTCLSASEFGAPHKRERWFLLAHAKRHRLRLQPRRSSGAYRQEKNGTRVISQNRPVADSTSPGLQRTDQYKSAFSKSARFNNWEIEPNVGRVVDGLPFRVDRIKALGNAVVPAQVSEAFKRLRGL